MRFINKITIVALAFSGVAANVNIAAAQNAVAASPLNVRSGPGTNFNVVSRLNGNQRVNVKQCVENAWCYVEHAGQDGWVSSKYLKSDGYNSSGEYVGDSCRMSFKIDSNGPSFKLNCSETPKPVPVRAGSNNEPTACLYTGTKYRGAEYCETVSNHKRLGGLNNIFASVKLFNGAKITLCSNKNFRGSCKTYTRNQTRLSTPILKKASSMKIFVEQVAVNSRNYACFYSRSNFGGTKSCLKKGVYNNLKQALQRRISSVKIHGNVSVKLCTGRNLSGYCSLVPRSAAGLNGKIDDRAKSMQIYAANGNTAPTRVEPAVKVKREIILRVGQSLNLDNGSIQSNGADVSFNEISEGRNYLRLLSGATISKASSNRRGYYDCKSASYSGELVSAEQMGVGTNLCVKTSRGRISQIEVKKHYNNAVQVLFKTY